MSFYTLAISSSNHDSCICLIKDGEVIVAWPCERTNRKKHCQNVDQVDIDVIKKYTDTVDEVILINMQNPTLEKTISKSLDVLSKPNAFEVSVSVNTMKQRLKAAGIKYKSLVLDNSNHHMYHASAGFHMSGFDDALCIIIDGVGTGWVWEDAMLSETTTIFHAVGNRFNTLHKHLLYTPSGHRLTGWAADSFKRVEKCYKFPVVISPHVDIGKMYGTVTRHIGYRSTDAGKTMGLSAYGVPNNLPPMLNEDSILSNANLFRNDSQINTLPYPELFEPSDQVKKNLAYNVQRATEYIFIKRIEQALSLRNTNNIVLGGGCALNILANSMIKKKFPHLNIYVEPIAADSSQALGAALFHYKRRFPDTKYKKADTLYLGPHYSIMDTKSRLFELVERYNEPVV